MTEQVAKFTRTTLKIHSLAHIFSFFGFSMNDKIMAARAFLPLDTAKRYLEVECIVNNIDRTKKMQQYILSMQYSLSKDLLLTRML